MSYNQINQSPINYSAITYPITLLPTTTALKNTLMESILINRDHHPLNKDNHSLPLELFEK